MSLFKARDWWQTQCGHGEEFDMGCLLVANIDNDSSGQVKILTGSFSGFLRVYLPRDRGYKPEDLLLETELEGGPVLALAAGRFTGSGGLQLAVLHPRKLSVYGVAAQGGGAYLQLSRLYEHGLEHTAANMTYGPFGGVQGCDYVCVQSYDGQVSFFEAEGVAFSRYLPSFLVPGPLAYVEASDSFVTCTAALELEAYKYKVIAAASSEKAPAKEVGSPQHRGAGSSPAGSGTSGGSKRVQADWKVVLGEAAIDIRVGRFSQGLGPHQADIVVLGEHNLFVLSSYTGQITFQKRLEYHPACCTTYPVPGAKTPGGAENLLVATHTKALLVYRTTVLSWAAKHDLQPVAVAVADLPAMRGAIVALDDTGGLSVGYLGTDPLLNPVGFTDGKELDYEAMAREHRALAQVIREHGGGGGGVRRIEPMDRLIMRAQVPQRLDAPRGGSLPGEDGLDDLSSLAGVTGGKRLTVRLYLALQGAHSCDHLTLSVSAPEPVTPAVPEIYVPSVSTNPTDPTLVLLTFAPGAGLPTSSTALVVATYTTPNGEPRSQRLDIMLPLCAFCTVVPPVKNAEFKVTLTTNRPPPPLGSLFEDALAAASPGVTQALSSGGAGAGLGLSSMGGSSGAGAGAGSTASVLTFQFYGGLGDVTILVSKAGGRYRIQSDVLEGMWLVCRELASRLARYFGEAEAGLAPPAEGPFAVSYEDALPLDDFFEVVEQHFAARLRVSDLSTRLENNAVQFRNIEKRLLMRFKDKNPAPLNQLDSLMNETYGGLMELGSDMEAAQAAVASASRRLSGCVQLLLLLVRWRFGLSEPEAAVMRGCIPPEVIDGSEVGWEETTEAAMTHLLRTCLAKNAKEQAVQVAPLAPVKNTERLRKHVSLVLERLARGMRLMSPADIAAAAAAAGGGGGGGGGAGGGGGGRSLYRDAPSVPAPAGAGLAGVGMGVGVGVGAGGEVGGGGVGGGPSWPGLVAVAEEDDGASMAGQPDAAGGMAGLGGLGGMGDGGGGDDGLGAGYDGGYEAGAYDGNGVGAGYDRMTVMNGEDGGGGMGMGMGGGGGGGGGGGFWSMDGEGGGSGGGAGY